MSQYYKKHYSIRQFYGILLKAIRTVKYMKIAKKKKLIDKLLIEKIMLAVTEVNGCPLCAYGHTKIAFETGMSETEIKNLLSGNWEDLLEDEAPAIIFAQHYADSEGNPSVASFTRLIEFYGETKAKGILGASRLIMFGNVYGMALSSFGSRFKGKPVKGFSIFYELGMIFSIVLFFPLALVHSFAFKIQNKTIIG